MSTKPPASGKSYRTLIHSITSALQRGFLAAQKALEYQRLKTYWEIGRDISRYGVRTQKLYLAISVDIEKKMGFSVAPDMIGRMVQLYDEYPKFPAKTTLTFTHYLALLRVADPAERLRLEQKAIKKGWSSPELKIEIAKMNALLLPPAKNSSKKLALSRGEPYIYSIHQYTGLSGEKGLGIDCGFKIDVPLNGMAVQSPVTAASDESRGVRVVKKDGRYEVHLYKAAAGKLYTYAAAVQKVVDADTLDVRIDVGFSIHLYDRLRFKGINGPEIGTQEGIAAKKFLTDYLALCPVVVIRTYKQKEEMYGRWLADIFALKGSSDPYRIAEEGEFLNQVLLDKGFAEVY